MGAAGSPGPAADRARGSVVSPLRWSPRPTRLAPTSQSGARSENARVGPRAVPVSYTHLRAHETGAYL
eukprot:7122894-Pyramimonas_sp.AAC.1